MKKKKIEKDKQLEWRKLGNLKITDLADVTLKGGSLYVLLRKDVAEVHGVVSGDKVRVSYHEHYRKIPEG